MTERDRDKKPRRREGAAVLGPRRVRCANGALRSAPGLLLASALLVAAVFSAYAPSLSGDFVVDDVYFIKESPLVRDLSHPATIFSSAFWESSSRPGKSYYRPLVVLSHALNFYFGGDDPRGYHLLNISLHCVNAVLLMFLICSLMGALPHCVTPSAMTREVSRQSRRSPSPGGTAAARNDPGPQRADGRPAAIMIVSFLAAWLWGLHPVNSESVAWISGRTDILATLFLLISLLAYVRAFPPLQRDGRASLPHGTHAESEGAVGGSAPSSSSNDGEVVGQGWTLLVLVSAPAFFLALLCKESVVFYPLLVAGYEAAVRPRALRSWLRPCLFAAVLAAYLLCRRAVLGESQGGEVYFAANPLVAETFYVRVLSGLAVFGEYLRLLLFPLRLSVDYSYEQLPILRSIFDLRCLAPLLAVAALVMGLRISWKRNPAAFFGLALFVISGALVLANALFPYAPLMAERFMYLPSMGLATALAAGLGRRFLVLGQGVQGSRTSVPARSLVAGWPRLGGGAAFASAVLVAAAFFVRSNARAYEWRSELLLFESAVESTPKSSIAHLGLANEYYERGRFDEADRAYHEALRIYPRFGLAVAGSGNVAMAQGRTGEALRLLRRAAALLPRSDEVRSSLGAALGAAGRLEEAVAELDRALALNPASSEIRNNLGNIQRIRGDRSEAERLWRESLELNPYNVESLYNLAQLCRESGREPEAREYLRRFVEIAPDSLADLKEKVRRDLSGAAVHGSPH